MMIRKHDAVLSIVLFLNLALAFSESDAEVLLKFKASLNNTAALANWNPSTAPCGGWKGVLCDGGHVWGLQLEDMALQGVIDVETLAKLPDLRSVSFMNNELGGSFPNFARLGALKTIFLSNNKFSGGIPDDAFDGMMSLKKLHLANNKFSGPIPATLATMKKLIELTLQENELEGKIPSFQQKGLKIFNVSNNKLDGEIPPSLRHLPASSFSGNKGLCGAPLQQCPAVAKDTSSGRKSPTTTIIVVAVLAGAVVIALLAICIFFLLLLLCKRGSGLDVNQMEKGVGGKGSKRRVRLTFLKDASKKFEMQELLKSSAEVLGTGALGSSYKARLHGKTMVVKRFKHMNKVSKQEFKEHMRRLGRMTHQNVHPILAFYSKKKEKLLVADFAPNRSLAARLHGNGGGVHGPLDWATRLKIVKGVARGLAYLHKHLPSLTPPHAHLKASNVLLDSSFNPLLTDYGLLPIINKDQAQLNMVAFNSPDFKNSANLNKKTDVWSFGMLVLEILTGKSSGLERQGEVELATWVQSAMSDGGVQAVLDRKMARSDQSGGEIMKLFIIALSCCQAEVESRPDIKEVAEKVEMIKEMDLES